MVQVGICISFLLRVQVNSKLQAAADECQDEHMKRNRIQKPFTVRALEKSN
jgi:hypothetical protein